MEVTTENASLQAQLKKAADLIEEPTANLELTRVLYNLQQLASAQEKIRLQSLNRISELNLEKERLSQLTDTLNAQSESLNLTQGSWDSLDMVSLEEFANDHPDIDVKSLGSDQLALERIKDEESRRADLFRQQMALNAEVKELNEEIEAVLESLDAPYIGRLEDLLMEMDSI